MGAEELGRASIREQLKEAKVGKGFRKAPRTTSQKRISTDNYLEAIAVRPDIRVQLEEVRIGNGLKRAPRSRVNTPSDENYLRDAIAEGADEVVAEEDLERSELVAKHYRTFPRPFRRIG